jgi:hypothetical protein
MAGITLEQAEARLALYLAAEEKILVGQAVEIDGDTLTRADLDKVQRGIKLWEGRIARLSSGGGLRVAEIIPR